MFFFSESPVLLNITSSHSATTIAYTMYCQNSCLTRVCRVAHALLYNYGPFVSFKVYLRAAEDSWSSTTLTVLLLSFTDQHTTCSHSAMLTMPCKPHSILPHSAFMKPVDRDPDWPLLMVLLRVASPSLMCLSLEQ